MMKKTVLILTAACSMATLAVQAQKKWTLDECISYAMEHNLTLQKARLNTQSAEEDVKGARAALLPSLNAHTSQTIGYRPWQENGTVTVTNGKVETKVDKAYYNGSYGINAQWTLWNGNKNYNTLKQNKLTAEQNAKEAEFTANSIQEQIMQLYVQILYLTEAVKVNEQSLETSRKNEERGQQMLEVGKMSKADVAQLTAQRATDEYNIVEAKANISKYTVELKQLLQLTTQDFAVTTPEMSDQQVLEAIPAMSDVYNSALAQRPEIASDELQVKSSELSIKMAKADRMPTLSMNGTLGTSTNSLSDKEWGNQLKTNFDMSAGLSLSVPIFDQRKTKTAVRKARIQKQQAELDLMLTQDNLYKTIEGYWLDAETNQQKFRAAVANVESEQASYDLLEEQFRLGLKNIVELMTGKSNLLTAQQNRLQSKYQTILAMQMLKFYEGNGI